MLAAAVVAMAAAGAAGAWYWRSAQRTAARRAPPDADTAADDSTVSNIHSDSIALRCWQWLASSTDGVVMQVNRHHQRKLNDLGWVECNATAGSLVQDQAGQGLAPGQLRDRDRRSAC